MIAINMKTKTFTSTLMATRGLIFLNILMAAMSLMMLGGCQQEVTEIIQPSSEDAITSGSDITSLISRTTKNDGSFDNIIDRTSCAEIVLPVTIQINGVELVLASREDFKNVEDILDDLDDDDDDRVMIKFPIKVILSDHSEIMLNDEDDLEDIIEQCTEEGFDDDIECVDFKYPLSISVYDSKNQLSDVITFNDDRTLYKFIDDLEDDDFASFNFPVTLVLSDGSELVVNSQNDLEDAIDSAKDDCDEDDDNDYNDDDVDDTEFITALTEGNWVITYFTDDDDNQTTIFQGYLFTFFANRQVAAVKNNVTVYGTWSTDGDDGSLELDLDFSDASQLDDLDNDWDVIEFDNAIIKLKDDDDRLTFERPSGNDEGGEDDLDELSQILITGSWKVTFFGDDDDDDSDTYAGYALAFTIDGLVTATKDQETISGAWAISIDDQGYKVILNFGDDDPFDDLNDTWMVISYEALKVEMKEDDDDKLIIERIP